MEQEPRLGGVFCGPSPKSWEDRKQCCGALVRGVLPLISPGPGPAGQDLLLYFLSAPDAPNRPKLSWRRMQSGRASRQNDSRSKAEETWRRRGGADLWLRRGPQICGFGGDRRSVASEGTADLWLRKGPQIRGFGGGRRSVASDGAIARPGGWCTPRAHIHVRTRGRGTSMCHLPHPPAGRRPSVYRCCGFVCGHVRSRTARLTHVVPLHSCRSRPCRRPRCRLRHRDTPHYAAVAGKTGSYKGGDIDTPKTWACGCVGAAAMDGRGSECAHGCAPEQHATPVRPRLPPEPTITARLRP